MEAGALLRGAASLVAGARRGRGDHPRAEHVHPARRRRRGEAVPADEEGRRQRPRPLRPLDPGPAVHRHRPPPPGREQRVQRAEERRPPAPRPQVRGGQAAGGEGGGGGGGGWGGGGGGRGGSGGGGAYNEEEDDELQAVLEMSRLEAER